MNPLYWPLIIVIPDVDVDVDVLNILVNNYKALQYTLKICEGFFVGKMTMEHCLVVVHHYGFFSCQRLCLESIIVVGRL